MDMPINYSLDRLEADAHDRTHIRRELLALKKSYAISGKQVVEFGCGHGHNLQLFAADNDVLGLEGLAAAVDKAVGEGLDVRECDLNGPTGLADASADVILCLDVLEHLVEPHNALLEMRRVLRPGGIAILNVPNHFDLGRPDKAHARPLARHARLFSRP